MANRNWGVEFRIKTTAVNKIKEGTTAIKNLATEIRDLSKEVNAALTSLGQTASGIHLGSPGSRGRGTARAAAVATNPNPTHPFGWDLDASKFRKKGEEAKDAVARYIGTSAKTIEEAITKGLIPLKGSPTKADNVQGLATLLHAKITEPLRQLFGPQGTATVYVRNMPRGGFGGGFGGSGGGGDDDDGGSGINAIRKKDAASLSPSERAMLVGERLVATGKGMDFVRAQLEKFIKDQDLKISSAQQQKIINALERYAQSAAMKNKAETQSRLDGERAMAKAEQEIAKSEALANAKIEAALRGRRTEAQRKSKMSQSELERYERERATNEGKQRRAESLTKKTAAEANAYRPNQSVQLGPNDVKALQSNYLPGSFSHLDQARALQMSQKVTDELNKAIASASKVFRGGVGDKDKADAVEKLISAKPLQAHLEKLVSAYPRAGGMQGLMKLLRDPKVTPDVSILRLATMVAAITEAKSSAKANDQDMGSAEAEYRMRNRPRHWADMPLQQQMLMPMGSAAGAAGPFIRPSGRQATRRGIRSMGSFSDPNDSFSLYKTVLPIGDFRENVTNATQFRDATRRVINWGVGAATIYGGFRQLTEGLRTLREYERAMMDVRKVANPLGLDFRNLNQEARSMGREFGTSIIDAAKSFTIFAQQGMGSREIIDNARASLMLTNVTTMDLVQSTEALTAAQRQFAMGTAQSMRIVDSFNEVENVTAVEATQLADAIKRAGTAMRVAGVDFDTTLGIVAAIGESTRKSGNEIGTAMKFIFQHMRDDKAVEALQSVGIFTENAAGQMKNAQQVIGELNRKWNGLTDAQRQQIAVAIAGTRHLNDFFVLMENWDRAIDISIASLTSQGSALRENNLVMQTLDKQLGQLKASYQSLWASVGDSGVLTVLKTATDLTRNLLDMFGQFNNALGGAPALALGSYLGIRGIGGAASWMLGDMIVPGLFDTLYVEDSKKNKKSAAAQQVIRAMNGRQGHAPGGQVMGSAGVMGMMGIPGMLGYDFEAETERRRRAASYRDITDPRSERYVGAAFLNRRRYLGIGAITAGMAAQSYWDASRDPSQPPTAADTAVGVGSTLLQTGGMIGMLARNRRPGFGWAKSQGIMLPVLVATALSGLASGYRQVRDFVGQRSASSTVPIEKQLDDLRAYQEKLGETRASIMEMTRRLESGGDVDTAAYDQLRDQMMLLKPELVSVADAGGDLVQVLKQWKEGIGEIDQELRAQRTGLISAQVERFGQQSQVLQAQKDFDAAQERIRSNRNLGTTEGRLQSFRDLAAMTSARSVLRPGVNLMLGEAMSAGQSGQGFMFSRDYVESQARQFRADPERVYRDMLRAFIRGQGGDISIDQQLERAGLQSAQDIRFYQRTRNGPILRLSDNSEVSREEVGSQFVLRTSEAEFGDGVAVTKAKQLERIINEFERAIEKLIKKNERLIENMEFVNRSIEAQTFGKGFGPGGGLGAIERQGSVIRRIFEQGVSDFKPVDARDPREFQLAMIEMTGDLLERSQNGSGINPQGLLSVASGMRSFTQDLMSNARREVENLLADGGARLNVDAPDEDGSLFGPDGGARDRRYYRGIRNLMTPETYNRMQDIAAEISRLRNNPQYNSDPALKAREEALRQRAFNAFIGEVQNKARTFDDVALRGTQQMIERMQQTTLGGVESLGRDFALRNAINPNLSAADYLTDPSTQGVRDTLRFFAEQVPSLTASVKQMQEDALQRGDTKEAERAAETLRMLSQTTQVLTDAQENLAQHVHDASVGVSEMNARFERAMSQAGFGRAFGQTGQAGDRFSADMLRGLAQQYLQESQQAATIERQEMLKGLAEQLGEAARRADENVEVQSALRRQAREGLLSQYLSGRALTGMGVQQLGFGNEFRTMIMDSVTSSVQSMARQFAEGRTFDTGVGDEFMSQMRPYLQELSIIARQTGLTQTPEYQRNYMLASPSSRALADFVQSQLEMGMTASDIFADPHMRAAAQNEPLIGNMLQQALERDLAVRSLDLASQQNDKLGDIRQILSDMLREVNKSRTSRGLKPAQGDDYGLFSVEPTGQYMGSKALAGKRGIGADGRVQGDNVPFLLHNDEVVVPANEVPVYESFKKALEGNKAYHGTGYSFRDLVMPGFSRAHRDDIRDVLNQVPPQIRRAMRDAETLRYIEPMSEITGYTRDLDGRFPLRGAYQSWTGGIALNVDNPDFRATFAHELGHAFDYTFTNRKSGIGGITEGGLSQLYWERNRRQRLLLPGGSSIANAEMITYGNPEEMIADAFAARLGYATSGERNVVSRYPNLLHGVGHAIELQRSFTQRPFSQKFPVADMLLGEAWDEVLGDAKWSASNRFNSNTLASMGDTGMPGEGGYRPAWIEEAIDAGDTIPNHNKTLRIGTAGAGSQFPQWMLREFLKTHKVPTLPYSTQVVDGVPVTSWGEMSRTPGDVADIVRDASRRYGPEVWKLIASKGQQIHYLDRQEYALTTMRRDDGIFDPGAGKLPPEIFIYPHDLKVGSHVLGHELGHAVDHAIVSPTRSNKYYASEQIGTPYWESAHGLRKAIDSIDGKLPARLNAVRKYAGEPSEIFADASAVIHGYRPGYLDGMFVRRGQKEVNVTKAQGELFQLLFREELDATKKIYQSLRTNGIDATRADIARARELVMGAANTADAVGVPADMPFARTILEGNTEWRRLLKYGMSAEHTLFDKLGRARPVGNQAVGLLLTEVIERAAHLGYDPEALRGLLGGTNVKAGFPLNETWYGAYQGFEPSVHGGKVRPDRKPSIILGKVFGNNLQEFISSGTGLLMHEATHAVNQFLHPQWGRIMGSDSMLLSNSVNRQLMEAMLYDNSELGMLAKQRVVAAYHDIRGGILNDPMFLATGKAQKLFNEYMAHVNQMGTQYGIELSPVHRDINATLLPRAAELHAAVTGGKMKFSDFKELWTTLVKEVQSQFEAMGITGNKLPDKVDPATFLKDLVGERGAKFSGLGYMDPEVQKVVTDAITPKPEKTAAPTGPNRLQRMLAAMRGVNYGDRLRGVGSTLRRGWDKGYLAARKGLRAINRFQIPGLGGGLELGVDGKWKFRGKTYYSWGKLQAAIRRSGVGGTPLAANQLSEAVSPEIWEALTDYQRPANRNPLVPDSVYETPGEKARRLADTRARRQAIVEMNADELGERRLLRTLNRQHGDPRLPSYYRQIELGPTQAEVAAIHRELGVGPEPVDPIMEELSRRRPISPAEIDLVRRSVGEPRLRGVVNTGVMHGPMTLEDFIFQEMEKGYTATHDFEKASRIWGRDRVLADHFEQTAKQMAADELAMRKVPDLRNATFTPIGQPTPTSPTAPAATGGFWRNLRGGLGNIFQGKGLGQVNLPTKMQLLKGSFNPRSASGLFGLLLLGDMVASQFGYGSRDLAQKMGLEKQYDETVMPALSALGLYNLAYVTTRTGSLGGMHIAQRMALRFLPASLGVKLSGGFTAATRGLGYLAAPKLGVDIGEAMLRVGTGGLEYTGAISERTATEWRRNIGDASEVSTDAMTLGLWNPLKKLAFNTSNFVIGNGFRSDTADAMNVQHDLTKRGAEIFNQNAQWAWWQRGIDYLRPGAWIEGIKYGGTTTKGVPSRLRDLAIAEAQMLDNLDRNVLKSGFNTPLFLWAGPDALRAMMEGGTGGTGGQPDRRALMAGLMQQLQGAPQELIDQLKGLDPEDEHLPERAAFMLSEAARLQAEQNLSRYNEYVRSLGVEPADAGAIRRQLQDRMAAFASRSAEMKSLYTGYKGYSSVQNIADIARQAEKQRATISDFKASNVAYDGIKMSWYELFEHLSAMDQGKVRGLMSQGARNALSQMGTMLNLGGEWANFGDVAAQMPVTSTLSDLLAVVSGRSFKDANEAMAWFQSHHGQLRNQQAADALAKARRDRFEAIQRILQDPSINDPSGTIAQRIGIKDDFDQAMAAFRGSEAVDAYNKLHSDIRSRVDTLLPTLAYDFEKNSDPAFLDKLISQYAREAEAIDGQAEAARSHHASFTAMVKRLDELVASSPDLTQRYAANGKPDWYGMAGKPRPEDIAAMEEAVGRLHAWGTKAIDEDLPKWRRHAEADALLRKAQQLAKDRVSSHSIQYRNEFVRDASGNFVYDEHGRPVMRKYGRYDGKGPELVGEELAKAEQFVVDAQERRKAMYGRSREVEDTVIANLRRSSMGYGDVPAFKSGEEFWASIPDDGLREQAKRYASLQSEIRAMQEDGTGEAAVRQAQLKELMAEQTNLVNTSGLQQHVFDRILALEQVNTNRMASDAQPSAAQRVADANAAALLDRQKREDKQRSAYEAAAGNKFELPAYLFGTAAYAGTGLIKHDGTVAKDHIAQIHKGEKVLTEGAVGTIDNMLAAFEKLSSLAGGLDVGQPVDGLSLDAPQAMGYGPGEQMHKHVHEGEITVHHEGMLDYDKLAEAIVAKLQQNAGGGQLKQGDVLGSWFNQ